MIGKTISHYKILEKLGEGGMGVVYKAEDTKLKRTVALKFLPPELTRDSEAKERFIHEARAAAALNHINIVTIHEINEFEGRTYIAMEYLEGDTLKVKTEDQPMPINEAIDVATQIAAGLNKAHKKDIIHRDIKSANIIVTEEGVVKILDFGLAKLRGVTKLTKEGTTLGTIAYMSPEQTLGEKVDHRSDIWSLGVLLYEMLTGELPFKGEYEQAVMYSIMNEEPEPVTDVRPDVPVTMGQVVSKALEKDPDKRYQHLDELLDNLRSLSVGVVPEEIKTRLLKAKLRKKKKTILYAVSAGLIIAMVVIALWQFLPEKAAVAPKIENSIAVISFENLTGDKSQDILERVIPNLLITNLENTGFFYVATWDRLRDLMKQLGKGDEENINSDLGFKLCLREGIEAIVLGSVMKVGSVFATEVKVFDVESGKLIKSSRSQGEGINSIINTQIDKLSREIALGVGITKEKLASVDFNISEFTTKSMEAYNYFIKGRDDFYDQYSKDAIIRLEKAVELDPNFAMAYLYLGYTYNNLALDKKKAKEYYEKAKVLSKNVTEKERLLIEAEYAGTVEGRTEKWLEILNKVVAKYPREVQAHLELSEYYRINQMYDKVIKHAEIVLALDPGQGDAYEELAFAYANTGNDEKALEYLRKGSAAIPGDPRINLTAGQFYVKMGNLDEAIKKFKSALDIKPDFTIQNYIAYAYAMKEDYAEALNWSNKFKENSPSEGIKAKGYWLLAFYHWWTGQLDEAVAYFQKAWDSLHEAGNRDFMSEFALGEIHAERGELLLSRTYYQNWYDGLIEIYPPEATEMRSYIALWLHSGLGRIALQQGHIDSARQHLKEMKALMPNISSPQKYQGYNVLIGNILISEGSYDEALSVIQESSRMKMPWIWNTQSIFTYNLDKATSLLAQAYKEKGDLDQAIEVYEQLTDPNPENREGRLIHPKNYYYLAECYEIKGLNTRAIKSYKKFLTLWKDADPGIAEIEDARKRLKELEGNQ